MSLFRKKQSSTTIDKVVEAAAQVDRQVSAVKEEQAVAAAENIEARNYTNNLLRKNGFTLTLYLAVHNPTGRAK